MNDEQNIYKAYQTINESLYPKELHQISTGYDWIVEIIDREYDDVLEVVLFDKLLDACSFIKENELPSDKKYMVGLARKRGSLAEGNVEDPDVAYVENGILPDRFPNIGGKIPQKYKLEFDKYKSCLPNLE